MIITCVVLGYLALCLLSFAIVTKGAEYGNVYKDTVEDEPVS